MSAEPVTSHAAAAAEIARLRGHVSALREALNAAKLQSEGVLNATYRRLPKAAIDALQKQVMQMRAALAATEEPGT